MSDASAARIARWEREKAARASAVAQKRQEQAERQHQQVKRRPSRKASTAKTKAAWAAHKKRNKGLTPEKDIFMPDDIGHLQAQHAMHVKRWRNKNPQISVCVPFATYLTLARIAVSRGTSLAALTRDVMEKLILEYTAAGALPEAVPASPPPRYASPVPSRESPIPVSTAVVMPRHQPTKTVSTTAVMPKPKPVEQAMADIGRGLSAADRAVLSTPAATPAVQHFYHPESDCYVSIPAAEVEAFRSSFDGALCTEVDQLPPGLEKEGILPNFYTPAPKKEDVKPAPKWSYKEFQAKRAK